MTKEILFIDDLSKENSNYISVLETAYYVDVTAFIATARKKLQKPERYGLIVLDIMMPTLGLFTEEETEDGLKTGLVYYERELKEMNIPVLFWSRNKNFKKEVDDKQWNNTYFVQKNSDEKHLLEVVDDFLGVNNFLRKIKK